MHRIKNYTEPRVFVSKRLIVLMVLGAYSFAYSSFAQVRTENTQKNKELDQIKEQIKETSTRAQTYESEAQNIKREVSKIQQELIKSASEIQTIEESILTKEINLKDLRENELVLEKSLKEQNFAMATTLGAMQRISERKTNLVLFRPDEAVNTLRTTSLLKVILPDLKNRAENIEGDLSELNSIRSDIVQQNEELRIELTKLIISNEEMDNLLKQRVGEHQKLELATRQERDKLKKFADNAKDLQDLIDQIEVEIALREKAADLAIAKLRDRPQISPDLDEGSAFASLPQDNMNFAQAKGNIPLPARGTINQVFGQLMTSGQRSKGITITTRAHAPVIAPHDGRIIFAGKFRSYGQLLIISHGEGYHTLLAGMENINGVVGQWVLKGEPVGQMSDEINSIASRQKLYVEFRQSGKPINPIPWIMASDRKVLG